MEDIKITRINELAKKSKESGLSEEEKTEQKILRQEFLKDVKGQLNSQLDRIKFVDETGKVIGDINDIKRKGEKEHKHNNCSCHHHHGH